MKTFLFIIVVYSVKSGMMQQSIQNVTIGFPGKLEQRIVKGYNCTSEEYKYLVSILFKTSQHCGGSLLASSWVLTAAHCCSSILENISEYSVIVGMRVWKQAFEQNSTIAEVYIHGNYSNRTLMNDICLLKLQNEIRPNKNVKLTKLVTSQEYNDLIRKKGWMRVTVVGFGAQQDKTRVNINPHVQCATLFISAPDGACFTGAESAFCASDPDKRERSPCYGDSGGPLFCDHFQIGLVSSTYGCELLGFPGYFTRVDIYKEFIDSLTMGSHRGVKNKTSEPHRATYLSCAKILAFLLFVYL